jgi:polyisoprenoid-binding protein YceI
MARLQKVAPVLIGFGLATASSVAGPLATGDSYRITTALVKVVCPLTVGGSFEAQTNAVIGDLAVADASGSVSGAVQVDLATLETGIGLRDQHMKDKYLEIHRSQTLTTASLEEIHIERAEEGSMPFHGRLTLHGEQHTISGMADLQAQPRGGGVRVRARFPISLAAFGIQPPHYLGVGVRDEVQVQVHFTAVSASDH